MINEEKARIQKEAFNALEANNFRGIIIMPTGTGKTLVLINCLRRLYEPGMRVLYTCDSKMLRDGGFSEELLKWNANEYDNRIEKMCYATAYKMENQEYDILLADEADYALTPEYSKLFLNNKFRYIILVSATLESKKRKLADQIAPIVYHKRIKEIEEKKVVNKANFFLVPYLLNKVENAQYLDFNERFAQLIDEVPDQRTQGSIELLKKWEDRKKKALEFLNISRIHFLAKLDSSAYICKKLLKHLRDEQPDCKILIFCGLTEQADRVCLNSFHSGNEDNNLLNLFDEDEILEIAVCGKVNRGKNLKKVNKIVLENFNRSETLMVQRTGRGRRLGVDEILDVYVLIPYFQKYIGNKGHITKPTIMDNWIKFAARNIGIENAKTIYLK